MQNSVTAAVLALAFTLVGCDGGSGSSGQGTTEVGAGTLHIEATDAPFEHEIVEVARIAVDRIQVHQSADADDGFLTLYEGTPIGLDLQDLQNGLARTLVRTEVPPGTYRQLRLRIADGYVRLRNGNEYSTPLGNLNLTSTATSGLKVFVDPPVVVQRGIERGMIVDFDLTKTFRPIPPNDPPNAVRFLVGPIVRAASVEDTGRLRGRVTRPVVGGGEPIGVEDATVYVLPPGETDPDASLGSTGTAPDGSYAVLGLRPGAYDVLVRWGTAQGTVLSQQVEAGAATVVDVELP